jgi:hypothetical protein
MSWTLRVSDELTKGVHVLRKCDLILGLTLGLAVIGCGDSGGGQASSPTTVTVEKTKTVEKPAPKEKAAKPAGGGGSGGGEVTVPNVVGKDHQLGQDTMQAAGLYNLREEDATGQGRLLIYDRNWTDVRQDPSAGSKVDPDAVVTLFAKKDGE